MAAGSPLGWDAKGLRVRKLEHAGEGVGLSILAVLGVIGIIGWLVRLGLPGWLVGAVALIVLLLFDRALDLRLRLVEGRRRARRRSQEPE